MSTAPSPRSGEVGEAATQTEPAKVDAGIQAELPEAARPSTNRQFREVAGSRPATNSRRPATKDGSASSRPATQQSRGKPATAAVVASPSGKLWPTQPMQTPTPASAAGGGGDFNGQPGVIFVDNNRTWQQYQESSRDQRQQYQGTESTPMVYSYNPDPRLRSWQSLEHARLHQMGLSSKLSRRYNVQRSKQFVPVGLHMRGMQQQGAGGQGGGVRAAFLPPLSEEFSENARKKNDVAPFLTFQKPTCGFYFSRETENRKTKHGLAPADLPSWGVDLLDRQG